MPLPRSVFEQTRAFPINVHQVYAWSCENVSPSADQGVLPLTGADISTHQTVDPLFMGVKVTVNVPMAAKFKESYKKVENVKTWPELILKVTALHGWPCMP